MQSVAKHILPNHRVGICFRSQIDQYGAVDVWKHRETQKAFYAGLMVCGCVWVCPVCASKISERRKQEVRKAIIRHVANNGTVSLMTLTFAHTKADRLKEILDKLKDALDRMRRQRRYRQTMKRLHLEGTITATEITYGDNGWHPHIHMMLFTAHIEPWEYYELENKIFDIWKASLNAVGLDAIRDYGLKIEGAEKADDYISKWGVEAEITKANTKKGREGNLTPFDMLRIVLQDGDLEYESRYKEFAKATKGKAQLVWSRDLKQKFGIVEKTDEQIAKEKEEPADLLGRLEWKKWRIILRKDVRAEFLTIVETQGFDNAVKWLDDLAGSSCI